MVENKTSEKKVETKQVEKKTFIVKGKPVSLRGRTFVGNVVSAKANKTVSVAWTTRKYKSKYQRYETGISKVSAHNPEEINAKEGDKVTIKETRPLSKTKHFIVTEVLKE